MPPVANMASSFLMRGSVPPRPCASSSRVQFNLSSFCTFFNSMSHSLAVIFDLVGTLDDGPGDDTVRERFRNYPEREVRT